MPDPGYRSLFERAPEALLAVERSTLRFRAASDCALKLLGCTHEKIERYGLPDILSPADLEKLLALADNRHETSQLQNCGVRDTSGKIRESDIAVSCVHEEGLLLISVHDATSRGRMQEQLRQGQKMEALGMLSGGIAHDFNNLLTIISGYSQMLMASARANNEKDRTAIEQILKASERAADLTSQLLAFSRRQSIQPKVLEINRIVDQTVTMLRRLIGEDMELRIEKAPDAGRIHADAGQIQQMLMNLAINSRDAMPQGGVVCIRTGNLEIGEEYIGTPSGHEGGELCAAGSFRYRYRHGRSDPQPRVRAFLYH